MEHLQNKLGTSTVNCFISMAKEQYPYPRCSVPKLPFLVHFFKQEQVSFVALNLYRMFC